jgi:hypothetical protein
MAVVTFLSLVTGRLSPEAVFWVFFCCDNVSPVFFFGFFDLHAAS